MFGVIYIETLIVYKVLDKFQHILTNIEGKILNGLFNFNRLTKHFKEQ